MPKDGEVFELTLDADNVDPLGMVRSFGYDPKNWMFHGTRLSGTITRRFMWVRVGHQSNLEGVRRACEKHGRVPEGQWLEAVKATFEHDVKWRGVADLSWELPDGGRDFPCVTGFGRSSFRWAAYARGDGWRWLVEVT